MKSSSENRPPRPGAAQIKLLERLCNACGVSGDEAEVRAIVLEQARAHLKERPGSLVKVDALGNVLVTCPGGGDTPDKRPRLMLSAHMDEVGLMVTYEEEKGIYLFELVGGIDIRHLVGKALWVGREHVPGVIGAKPIHLVQPDERKNAITMESLRIDVGAGKDKVKIGDRAAFATPFTRLGQSLRGKALDDRLGVSILLELLRNAPPNVDLLAAFTVQEEVGARGARVAAYAFAPDLAIAIDSTPAYDLPHWEDEPGNRQENTVYNSRLGAGPAIYVADASTLSDPRLVRHLVETAEALGIPYQIRQPGGGGTDAGAIHKQLSGIPSVSVSVPGRYHHTPVSLARLSDWQNTFALLHAALRRYTPEVLAAGR
jgi:endoglucanase